MKSNNKILGIIAVVLAFAVLLLVYMLFGQQNKAPEEIENTGIETSVSDQEPVKEILLEVHFPQGEIAEYTVSTSAKYLSQAMDEAEGLTYSGKEGPYGLMLEKVNGVSAVYETDGAYWSILVDGEYGMYGIDSQPVEDGVTYSLVYTLA